MKENKRNFTLDLIRGVSALIVMAGHLRAALFIDFSSLNQADGITVLDKFFYFITSLGHQAVMVFFVLSGFFVGGSIIKAKTKFNLKYYLIARLSRLWTPLLPILLFTLIIDYFTGMVSREILEGNHFNILNSGPSLNYSNSFLTFISNIFFFQTVFTPVFGSNGPLWSLANEFWYYMLFPLLLVFSGFITKKLTTRLLYGLAAILIISFVSTNMMLGFFIWLMGVIVYLIIDKKLFQFSPWLLILSSLLFTFSLLDSKFKFLISIFSEHAEYSDILVGITFSAFLISVINIELPNWSFLNLKKISYYISEISYTLYISHFPLIILIYTLFYSENQMTTNILSMTQFLFWFLFLILVGAVLWYIFEKNTPFVRAKFKKILQTNFL